MVTHTPHLIKAVLPYLLNLISSSADLHPHCTAKDWLEKWLPHPDTLTALGFPAASELQERVKVVTLQGWEESTHTTYSMGLLVFHVFCDNGLVPKMDHAPAKAPLISSFVSALTGSLLGKTIHNYVYSVQAWHTLYGLPWVLHEEQMNMVLKGAANIRKIECCLFTLIYPFLLTKHELRTTPKKQKKHTTRRVCNLFCLFHAFLGPHKYEKSNKSMILYFAHTSKKCILREWERTKPNRKAVK